MVTRRSLLAAPVALASIPGLRDPAHAKAPLAGATPAVYRFKVGTFEVAAIADGTLPLTLDLFPETKGDPATTQRLIAEAGFAAPPVRTFVNTFLINTGERLVLVDTGTGDNQAFGPNLGQLPRNLAALGVDPAAVDAVIITHLHPDHELGLSPKGTPFFPNAELIIHAPEHAFWTDEATASRAPAGVQPFFQMAQAAIRPYASRTRRADPGEVAPGIRLEAAPGHTPGHAAVHVSSGSDQLLIIGDAIASSVFQFERPDWTFAFDADPALAVQTRRRILDRVAQDRLLIGGSHLPFPGFGYAVRRGGAFAYAPAQWQG